MNHGGGLVASDYANTNTQFYGSSKVGKLEFSIEEIDDLVIKRGRKVIIVHNNIFDVTDYLHHPGGLRFCNRTFATDQQGYDRTEMFEETIHTNDTRDSLLQFYLIGFVKGATNVQVPRLGEYKFANEVAFKPIDLRQQQQGGDNALVYGSAFVVVAAYAWWAYGKSKK